MWGRETVRFGSGIPLRPCNGAEPGKAQEKEEGCSVMIETLGWRISPKHRAILIGPKNYFMYTTKNP